jgi:hypothetical protein
VPTSTGATAAGRVLGRAALNQMRMSQGRLGNFEKSGARPSRKAFLPSWPSSDM